MDNFIAFLIISAFIILGAVVSRLIYGIKHKKKKTVVLSSCVLIAPILLILLNTVIFPTSFPLSDSLIIGKSKEEIIDIYGEGEYNYDLTAGSKMAYCLGVDEFCFGLVRNNCSYDYYCIYFDKNGIATRVKEESVCVGDRHPRYKVYNFFDR